MKNTNKSLVDSVQSQLNATSGLRASADYIESKRAEILDVFTDLITEQDKEKLKKLRQAYEAKEQEFQQNTLEAKFQGKKLSANKQVAELIRNITAKDIPTAPSGGTMYDNIPKDFLDKNGQLLGNSLANLDTFRNDAQDIVTKLNDVTVEVSLSGGTKENRNINKILSRQKDRKDAINEIQEDLQSLQTNKDRRHRIRDEKQTNLDAIKRSGAKTSDAEYISAKNELDDAQKELVKAQKEYDSKEQELLDDQERLNYLDRLYNQVQQKINEAENELNTLKLIKNNFLLDTNEKNTVKNMLLVSAVLEKKLEGNTYGEDNVDTYHFLEELKDTYDNVLTPAVTGLLHTREILAKIDETIAKPANDLRQQPHKDQIKLLYDGLVTKGIDINGRLEQIHDKHYIAQLEYAMHTFFKEYPAEKAKREQLSDDEKRYFIEELIYKTGAPTRGGTHISEIDKNNNVLKDEFYQKFKDKISEEYEGDITDEIALKKFIEEKIGTFKHAEPNPEYALGLMNDLIKAKYKTKEAEIGIEFNKYLRGLDDGSVTAPKPSIPGVDDELELTATVADTESISVQQAKEQAMKQIEQKYNESVPFGLTRARLFFFRSKIVKRRVDRRLKQNTGQLVTNGETSEAVNRRALTKAMDMAGADKITQIDQANPESPFNDPIFQDRINNLITQYVSQTVPTTDEQFQQQIEQLFNNNAELRTYIRGNQISQIGSNIIEIVKSEKAEREYYGRFIEIINRHGRAINTPEFDREIRANLQNFINEQKKLPHMVKDLGLDVDALDFSEKLATHRSALEKMRTRTVKMKLNMLINSHPMAKDEGFRQRTFGGQAQDQRGLTTAQEVQIDKLGGRSAFYRWMEKHPRRTILGTSGAVIASTAIAPASLSVGVGAVVIGALNYFKKRGHYTKEHAKFEEKLLQMTPTQRDQYMQQMEQDAERRPMWLRAIFPKKFDKFGKSMEYINRVQNIQGLIDNIQTFTNRSGVLSSSDLTSLQGYLATAIATMQLKEDEGRNFTFSDEGKQNIEKLYNELYKSIHEGLGRYAPGSNPDAAIASLGTEIGNSSGVIRNNSEYEENARNMRRIRTKLGILAGAKAAGIYLLAARASGKVVEAWNQMTHHDITQADIIHKQMDLINAQTGAEQAKQAADQAAQAANQKLQAANEALNNASTSDAKLQAMQQQLEALKLQERAGELQKVAADKAQDVAELTQEIQNMGQQAVPQATNNSPNATNGNPPVVPNNTPNNPITTQSTLQLDKAFGVDGSGNPDGHLLLDKIFDGDQTKLEAFKQKISALQSGDRNATLRGTIKDIYGGDHALANEKTRAFFDNFSRQIHEGAQQELIKLTTQSPLTANDAQAIAAKMNHRYQHAPSNLVTPTELRTATNPAEIQKLFEGFASGRYDLTNLPPNWNINTANDALHCKYAGFGDGLKEYIFDMSQTTGGGGTTVPPITTPNPTPIVTPPQSTRPQFNRRRFTKVGVPTVWNDINDFDKRN